MTLRLRGDALLTPLDQSAVSQDWRLKSQMSHKLGSMPVAEQMLCLPSLRSEAPLSFELKTVQRCGLQQRSRSVTTC